MTNGFICTDKPGFLFIVLWSICGHLCLQPSGLVSSCICSLQRKEYIFIHACNPFFTMGFWYLFTAMLRVVIKLIYLESFNCFQTTTPPTAWLTANPSVSLLGGVLGVVFGVVLCLVVFLSFGGFRGGLVLGGFFVGWLVMLLVLNFLAGWLFFCFVWVWFVVFLFWFEFFCLLVWGFGGKGDRGFFWWKICTA